MIKYSVISLLRYVANGIQSILPPTRANSIKVRLLRIVHVDIGSKTIVNSGMKVWGEGRLSIGDKCWLGLSLRVIVPSGAEVVIESNVDIGPYVLIECGTHEIGCSNRRAGKGRVDNVTVGRGTWIGCQVTLLGGANIGAGSVVAAGAIVLPGSYPRNAILAGVPARVVRIITAVDVEGEDK
jgi:maltose O-acetyltransferase